MNQRQDSSACGRESELIAFLYGEADEREARDFQLHLQHCSGCREEVASFGVVREAITTWRDEALAGFVAMPLSAQPEKKSALAALRKFFDLSPLWLKAATAFAAVAFCVLVGLVIFRTNNDRRLVPNVNPGAVYTAQDVDRMVKEALARQESVKPPVETPSPIQITEKSSQPKIKRLRVPTPSQFAQSQRPLSKEEREQLAAELRLLSNVDETALNLLEDRINR